VGSPRHRPQRNWGARIREYAIEEMPAVALEGRRLRVGVLAGRGADVFEFLDKRSDVDFCWRSPTGIHAPADYLGSSPDGQSAFLDHYAGGWQEVFPNGGPTAEFAGARFGQHGEVCQLPWDYEIVEDTPAAVAVRFSVRGRKVPVLLERTMAVRADDAVLEVYERLVNESDVELRAMWGLHVVLGTPYLAPGASIRVPDGTRVLPDRTVVAESARRVRDEAAFAWPHATGSEGQDIDLSVLPEPGAPSEMLYLTDLAEGWYEVHGEGPAFRLEWDIGVLPYLWLWQELGAGRGYPWYGRPYVTGLEPFSSYPTDGLPAAVANGTALSLAGREERHLTWSARAMVGEGRPRRKG
jgi:hypothetical protein